MDKVFVKGLKTSCIIGILPQERVKEQELTVDLTLGLDLKEAGKTGDLTKSVDYAALSARVLDYVKKRKAELLEELGVELCTLILNEFKPQSVTVRLGKPQAVSSAETAGIEITM